MQLQFWRSSFKMVKMLLQKYLQTVLMPILVANLPAEIAHLLEEIQAKDRVVQDCRSNVATRDASIQKFLKVNGAGQINPKDEQYSKVILANYEKAQIYQEEKIGLSDRAAILLDRQIKRLDLKIRDLQNEGAIAIDPQLPSLLNNTSTLSTRWACSDSSLAAFSAFSSLRNRSFSVVNLSITCDVLPLPWFEGVEVPLMPFCQGFDGVG